jgi:hypothetical protein
MKSGYHDAESITEFPPNGAEQPVRVITIEELQYLMEGLFADPDHPWCEPFRRYIDENAGSTFYHARTKERIEVIYCPAKDSGIWVIPKIGVGVMHRRALNAMKGIVDAR